MSNPLPSQDAGVTFMRAAVCTRYGPPEVLQIQDVEKPVPDDREVLIKIHATSVSSSDLFVRDAVSSAPLAIQIIMRLVIGITKPRKPILGLVLAGEIEATGALVKRFRVGERVYAFTNLRFGSYAQYTTLPEDGTLAAAPTNLSYEEAVAIPYGGLLALHYLRRGNIRSGQKLFIYGASGAVGTAAIQLAKHFGASVTAVCSTANLELARSLGADAVIDYTREDTPGGTKLYDLVFDAVGKRKTSKLKGTCKRALVPGGKFISVDDGRPQLRANDLALLSELAQQGKIKAIIDRCYPLERIVEAHRYVEQGHKKGNVVVTIGHEGA